MDIQGSQFHLIHGPDDWGGCRDTVTGELLAAAWAEQAIAPPSVAGSSLEYDQGLGALRLRHDLPLFRRAGRTVPLDPSARRGAGRDGYGNWYWIDDDQASIRWRPTDDGVSALWWSAAQLSASCADAGPSVFAACPPPPPADLALAGLAVTTHHFLAAGYVAADERGLLLFDLQAGGAPMRLIWPAPFAPFDLADTPDGGLLVLDRQNAAYFQLDEHFRLRGHTTTTEGPFGPAAGGPAERFTGPASPSGSPLYAGSPLGPIDAVSIEPGPSAGSALILDSDPARGYSVVHLFDPGGPRWSTSLAGAIEVIDAADPTDTPQQYSLLGLDFAYLVAPPATGPLPPPMLYIADAEGQQVVAFSLDATSGALEPQPDFLPLRRWDGKALVRAGNGAWYDFGDRWVPLEVYTECRFEPAGSLTTPVDFAATTPASTASPPAGVPGQTFDSQLPGCVWHRLLLDAQVPTGTMTVQAPWPSASPPGQLPEIPTVTSLAVRARAADDPALLVQSPWLSQPVPYLRTDGAELAWYDPWADLRATDGSLPAGTGTYELLFQQVTGRYLQIELSLAGGGRSSPAVRSLRAWYPRFSYPGNYLPAVYRQDAAPYGFLERFLANFEGFYTVTEERIEHSSLLLDARTAPPGDLAWLASWFGLVLDPQWNEVQQRFLVRNVDRFYRYRGTPGGLLATLLAYLNPQVDDSVFDCGGDAADVRIVERFRTRDGGGAAYGDPAALPGSGSEADRAAATAHRFDVLVPAGLSADALAMIERIVAVNTPAHASYNIRGYYDLFIVGQARLGIDTHLGDSPSFSPMVVGQGYLAATYLGFPHPFELTDRIVIDRDRVGGLSPL
ncbi:MAG: phage tail protein [Streptosporangiaceae bacterium]|jgi:phage tail-like protein